MNDVEAAMARARRRYGSGKILVEDLTNYVDVSRKKLVCFIVSVSTMAFKFFICAFLCVGPVFRAHHFGYAAARLYRHLRHGIGKSVGTIRQLLRQQSRLQ